MRGSRFKARKDALKKPKFMKALKEALLILDEYNKRFALIGGIAVSVRANPPATVDIDFLVKTTFKDYRAIINMFEEYKWEVDILMLGMETPRDVGLTGARYGVRVDFLITNGDWFLEKVVRNSTNVDIGGVSVPTATTEDLYLMKMLAGRDKDVADMRVLRRQVGFDKRYVTKLSTKLLNEGRKDR